jgi:hypothetical protein
MGFEQISDPIDRMKISRTGQQTMTTQTNAPRARSFSKIVPATITFNETVSKAKTVKGVDYKKSANATVAYENGKTETRTVMGFGAQIDGIKNLAKGKTVRLAVQRDGGSVKIVGLVREKAAAAA